MNEIVSERAAQHSSVIQSQFKEREDKLLSLVGGQLNITSRTEERHNDIRDAPRYW